MTTHLNAQPLPGWAHSDRIVLPQGVLEAVVNQHGGAGAALPTPLTFRLANAVTGVHTFCGVREFSAPDGVALVPADVLGLVGLAAGGDVTVELATLPKGTGVLLRPLGTEYLAVDDWKALLESSLQAAYTTLTEGQVFSVLDPASQTRLRFLADRLEPKTPLGAVCIIDTDLNVDIEAMSEDQARKSVAQRDARRAAPKEGVLLPDVPVEGQLTPAGESVAAAFFRIEGRRADRDVVLTLATDVPDGADGDARSVDVFVATDGRPGPAYFTWSTLATETNTIAIAHTNDALAAGRPLLVAVVSGAAAPVAFSLTLTQPEAAGPAEPAKPDGPPSADHRLCTNCGQYFPSRSYQLHSAFCERNNILCPLGCGQLFRRSDGGVPAAHWHCPDCEFVANCASTAVKHTEYAHTPRACIDCGEGFSNGLLAGVHRASVCPRKLVLCRFCHLLLPQDDPPTGQIDILEGYTGHESQCGNRTTECDQCGRITRLRDMKRHLELHDFERINRPAPRTCSNTMCVRTLAAEDNVLGLCSVCFGPLYSPLHDPTGAKLMARVDRRYYIQLASGCGKAYCTNKAACATAAGPARLVPADVGGAVAGLRARAAATPPELAFCVDQATTKRLAVVDWIADDGEYARAWICAAAMAVPTSDDVEGYVSDVRRWLGANAVRVAES
ncbi:ubiquitin fusion degradation protein UFD1-domain-containing protein [Dipodascopsis tothii]|uniref:ubiquitin fusion degradation protein UFD1-domain-containing protein n=1 Tax=Dipodascopsis tothii TaxID=44089 RepID=UPI0034CF37C2